MREARKRGRDLLATRRRGDNLEFVLEAALRAPPLPFSVGKGPVAAAPRRRSVATTRRRRTGRRRRGKLGRLHPGRTAAHLLAALESATAFGPWRPRPLEAIFGLRGAAVSVKRFQQEEVRQRSAKSSLSGRRHATARQCFSKGVGLRALPRQMLTGDSPSTSPRRGEGGKDAERSDGIRLAAPSQPRLSARRQASSWADTT